MTSGLGPAAEHVDAVVGRESIRAWLMGTGDVRAAVLVRLMVGGVFLSEGIQKWLFPASRGAGRFAQIGLPKPELLGPFVGATEIVCGLLVLLGLLGRLAPIPLVVVMLTAIATTKIPILVEQGFWEMAHAARTDFSMLMGSIFLIVVGPGPWSLGAKVRRTGRAR